MSIQQKLQGEIHAKIYIYAYNLIAIRAKQIKRQYFVFIAIQSRIGGAGSDQQTIGSGTYTSQTVYNFIKSPSASAICGCHLPAASEKLLFCVLKSLFL